MIQKLSDDLVNQIAAGEVVERPAHLVKELVENSLDANADEIEIQILSGGRSLTIRDNGAGISSNELPLAIERHTTSKINKIDDLWNVTSFGFRGEALASAASVSEMFISSRPEKQSDGASLKITYGKVGQKEKASVEKGTTIRINNLFENVPARLKFLKSDSAEVTQIKSALKALALAHHNVTFRVLVENDLVFYWPKTEQQMERVKAVLEVQDIFETRAEIGAFKALVYAGSPNQTVQQNKKIWTFVKNRWVQDKGLQMAVIEAYRSLLMHGEYPIAVVFLDCPSDEIDVNIHPTKSQVKFKDASQAFRVVHRATRSLLEKAPWLSAIVSSATSATYSSAMGATANLNPNAFSSGPAEFSETNRFQASEFEQIQFKKIEPFSSFQSHPFESARSTLPTPDQLNLKWSLLQPLAQLNLTYILAQAADGLLMIDQHAAHERVLFEKLKKQLVEKKSEVQSFLIPLVIDFSAHEVEILMSWRATIEKEFSISCEQMGPESIAVTAAPSLLTEESLVAALKKMAHELVEWGDSFSIEKAQNDIFATLACHSAIRAGHAMSLDEMKSLLLQMDEFSFSSFCPHGRPVYVHYTLAEIEKDFGRIV